MSNIFCKRASSRNLKPNDNEAHFSKKFTLSIQVANVSSDGAKKNIGI
jgi:hypothetical protein